MRIQPRLIILSPLAFAASLALAQGTLGGITGNVTDGAGAILPDTTVTATDQGTGLARSTTTNSNGAYSVVNLPIGRYTLTVSREGFASKRFPDLTVQAGRTLTLPATLTVGAISSSVTVQADPLLNTTETTNGYVLETAQIQSTPLSTGSFTGLAILSSGVNAELPGGTGANAGLGNQSIWANGQRDTSNSFLLNGVDGSNLFNGKSTSQVASDRVTLNTGVGNNGAGGVVQSSASVYLSIGNALPTPPPEMLQEVRVNASMYDVSQGSTSGAHIDMSTASGTNLFHGQLYGRRGTDWINAAPFFFKQDPDIPANAKVPQLHRYLAGGTLGGPLLKDKLFGFVGYQHLHVSDAEIGDSFLDVPVGLSDTNRDAAGLAALSNASFCTPADLATGYCTTPAPLTGAQVSPVAVALFNLPAQPGQPGKFLIPNPTVSTSPRNIPTTPSSPAAPPSSPTRPPPTSTSTPTPETPSHSATSISTIPPSRPTPTPTSPVSLSSSTPVPRTSPSTTPSSSSPISPPSRRSAFFAKRSTPTTDRPSAPMPSA